MPQARGKTLQTVNTSTSPPICWMIAASAIIWLISSHRRLQDGGRLEGIGRIDVGSDAHGTRLRRSYDDFLPRHDVRFVSLAPLNLFQPGIDLR